MPTRGTGHAATIPPTSKPSEMDSSSPARLLEEPLPQPPGKRTYNQDDAAVTRRPPLNSQGKQLDKRSWDYIARTGLAGGLAGCAVGRPLSQLTIHQGNTLTRVTGQNRRRSPRSSQNPFPGLKPAIRQVYRELVRRCHGDARHKSAFRGPGPVSWPFSHAPQSLPLRRYQISGL